MENKIAETEFRGFEGQDMRLEVRLDMVGRHDHLLIFNGQEFLCYFHLGDRVFDIYAHPAVGTVGKTRTLVPLQVARDHIKISFVDD